jgi:uncharacterized membrane protein
MINYVDVLQLISIPIIAYNIFLLFRWSKRNSRRRLWAISMGAYLIHALIFYVYVQIVNFFPETPKIFSFTPWSSVIRLQGYIVILMVSITIDKLNGKLDGHHGK